MTNGPVSGQMEGAMASYGYSDSGMVSGGGSGKQAGGTSNNLSSYERTNAAHFSTLDESVVDTIVSNYYLDSSLFE